MPILQIPPNPARSSDSDRDTADEQPTESSSSSGGLPPRVLRTSRYGELQEHELIHLLDSLDDERARAQFRESVYISTIICLAIAWFLFYGPHIILHQPYYKDPIALMKQHDLERLTYVTPAPPMPATPPKIDRKTLQQLQKQAQEQAKATPQPPAPQAPAPQPQIAKMSPQTQMPNLPTPAAPKPNTAATEAPLPAAPKPTIADNSQSPGQALRDAMRGAASGPNIPSAPMGGSPGPLQAGAQILSDTQGVDFNAYMRRLRADLYRNWIPLMPAEVEPPIRKRGIVGIRFSILPDGQIGDMKLETQSGDVALDKAAWYSITSEGQFPPLPKAYHGPQLDLRIGFYYNQPIDQ
jgi:outer membrane biosynthesis protein TonB